MEAQDLATRDVVVTELFENFLLPDAPGNIGFASALRKTDLMRQAGTPAKLQEVIDSKRYYYGCRCCTEWGVNKS